MEAHEIFGILMSVIIYVLILSILVLVMTFKGRRVAHIISTTYITAIILLSIGLLLPMVELWKRGDKLYSVLCGALILALYLLVSIEPKRKLRVIKRKYLYVNAQELYIEDRSKYDYGDDEVLRYDWFLKNLEYEKGIDYILEGLLKRRCMMSEEETRDIIHKIYGKNISGSQVYDVIEIEALLNKNLEFNLSGKLSKILKEAFMPERNCYRP